MRQGRALHGVVWHGVAFLLCLPPAPTKGCPEDPLWAQDDVG